MTINNPVEPSDAMLPCPWCEQHLVWDCENDVWRHQNAGFCIGEQVLVEAKKVTAWNTRPAMQSAASPVGDEVREVVERLRLQSELGLFGLPEDHDFVSYGEAADLLSRLGCDSE